MRCDIKARWYGLLASIGAAVVLCSCASDKAGVDGHAAQEVADPLPRNVLIITGEDYPGHKWRQTTPVLASAIRADARLNVEVLDDLGRLGEEDLGRYAAIVLHFKNYDPAIPGRRGFERLVQFVNDDGGLVLVHFACGAFEEFDHDYEQLVGRIWFGANPPPGEHQHDPYGQFRVEFTDLDHEISRGLASFDTTDELYTCLTGEAPIEVIATARSKVNGRRYPIAFVALGERGRVFQCVLGHDVAALSNDGVGELFRRATSWAAGLPPAPDEERCGVGTASGHAAAIPGGAADEEP